MQEAAPSNKSTERIRQIHTTDCQLVLVVTGGGSEAISRLLQVPGGSRTVLEARVPYSSAALADWLGRAPEHYCGQSTALGMASVAERRARKLAGRSAASTGDHSNPSIPSEDPAPRLLGVSCTASLASDRPKRGHHRCHIAIHSQTGTRWLEATLNKGARSRLEEEHFVSDLILDMIARDLGLPPLESLSRLDGDVFHERFEPADSKLPRLFQPEPFAVWRSPTVEANSSQVDSTPWKSKPKIMPLGVLPGAFNPLHDGHRQLRSAAANWLHGPVGYEMSVLNVDKPPLDYISLSDRTRSWGEIPSVVTNVSRFHEKSRLLPGAVFVVGIDTARRVLDPKYHGNDPMALGEALETIRRQNCRFLVAGRELQDRFETLSSLEIPHEYRNLFEELPESHFRNDISSTEIRQQQAKFAVE